MADLGLITAKIRGLPPVLQLPMLDLFRAFIRDLRFGHPKGEQPDPAVNFGGGFFTATTAAIAGNEFSITHGFGRVPYLAIPILPLDVVGVKVVPVTVSRAADDKRVYFTSTSVSAPVTFYIEG